MKYASREIMDVVLKNRKTGEPVVFLESLTTSTIEFAGSTVYARGGKGHPKLVGWDSEKEITLNMEDALISKESLAVLTGSKFTKAAKIAHKKEVVTVEENASELFITLSQKPLASQKFFAYKTVDGTSMEAKLNFSLPSNPAEKVELTDVTDVAAGDKILVDYYYTTAASTQSLNITSDLFPGTYLLEGTTLWRNEEGYDVEALYTIPKLKVLPNFSIPMTSSGEPSPFTFNCEVLKDTASTAMITIDILEEE